MGTMNASQLNYVADLCESALYGAFSVLILLVIWILFTAKKMTIVHKCMFFASIIMWAMSTAHLGLLIQRLSYGKSTLWEAKAAVSLATLQLMVSDTILVWRVYAVWGKSYWTIIIPAILEISAAAVRFSVVANGTEVLRFVSDPASFIVAANTVYCTSLIAGRIYYLQYCIRKAAPTLNASGRNRYQAAVLMIIESGALHTLSLIISIIIDKVNSPGIHVALDINMPLTGILPTLILLTVHFELAPGSRVSSSEFMLSTDHEFQTAEAPAITFKEGTSIGYSGSKTTVSTLKDGTSDEPLEKRYEV